jgi:hypothetical protein
MIIFHGAHVCSLNSRKDDRHDCLPAAFTSIHVFRSNHVWCGLVPRDIALSALLGAGTPGQ